MKAFKDMGIVPEQKGFVGDKIKIDRLLNREIIVQDFKVEDSHKKPGTKYLQLQIEINMEKSVVFTGSTTLISMIEKVKKEDFPFTSTIIKNDTQQLVFT